MGYIDPWQIPTPMPDPKPKKELEDRGGTPASEELLEGDLSVVRPRQERVSPTEGSDPA